MSQPPSADAALGLLREHLNGPLGPTEAEMARLGVAFIEAHADCLLRSCLEGHLTGSAWVVNPSGSRTLLVLHRKLGRWLNPGGHADGDPDLAAVALREVREETGLASARLASPNLFDFDRHWIPEHKGVPGHHHYDFRFLVTADDAEGLQLSEESDKLSWMDADEALALNSSESIQRLVSKAAGRFQRPLRP